jgi:F-type H+-transporting ATPase subunit b
MPQLDPSVFSPQLIWLAITFAALYLILARSALPKVADVLDERDNKIADDLRISEELKDQSKALEAEYEKTHAEAKAEANRILAAAREKMQAAIDAKRRAAEAKLADEVHAAEDRIAAAKNAATDDLEDMAVEACGAIVARLTGKSIGESGLRDAVKGEIRAAMGGKA